MMSMQDHPDKNEADAGLDGLFRKSAEEFEPPYDPTAWQDMQRRLNNHDRTVLWKTWTRRVLPAGLILLLLTGSYWFTQQQPNKTVQDVAVKPGKTSLAVVKNGGLKTPDEQERNRKLTNGSAPPETGSESPATVPAEMMPVDERGKTLAESRSPEPLVTNHSALSHRTGERVVGVRPFLKPAASANKAPERTVKATPGARQVDGLVVKARDSFRPNGVGKRTMGRQTSRNKSRLARVGSATNGRINLSVALGTTNRQGNGPPVIDRRLLNPDYVPGADETVGIPTKVSDPREAYFSTDELPAEPRLRLGETGLLMNRPARWPEAIALTDRIPAPSASVRQPSLDQPPLASRTRLTGLSIQLVASPDLSAIGLRNVGDAAGNRPGTNLGLLLSYRLSSRWSLQTGVLHSVKVYKASGDDYVWPPAWKWALWFDGVDARCAMLDVPLNVRYDVVLRPRLNKPGPARWFVTGGVTSYVILKERYDYRYDDPTNPLIQARNWEGKTGTYGLSELNLSVGYEQPISRRLSWQVEPFMKVPLRQVGFFKVRLISTGAFFSLRYRL